MSAHRLTRAVRLSAVASAVLMASAVALASPAAAAVPGPAVSHLHFQWVPGTGNVHAVADITCGRHVTDGRWSVSLAQHGAAASASTRVRCDGHKHRMRLVLDPRRGRFHPGNTLMSWTTSGCQGDLCWVGIADGFAHIDRPGHARGPA
jgi:hypothetical protein